MYSIVSHVVYRVNSHFSKQLLYSVCMQKELSVHKGNVGDHTDYQGWFMGHFMPKDSPMHSCDLEIKWGTAKAGWTRDEWASAIEQQTISILISGECVMLFPDGEVILKNAGDYVIWQNIEHGFRAITDCTVLTIRWPSVE